MVQAGDHMPAYIPHSIIWAKKKKKREHLEWGGANYYNTFTQAKKQNKNKAQLYSLSLLHKVTTMTKSLP